MKLVDNSHQSDQSPTLGQPLQFAKNNGAAVNVFKFAQSASNTNLAIKKPKLVKECTILETERLWKKRLSMLLDAENNLMKVLRFRKITGISTVASMAMFLFSLYVAPTMSPALFYCLIAVASFGMATYPVWLLASKTNKKQRDDISRLFYKSNHEVDMSEGKITLINRANYANVTQIRVLDRELGLFANS
ncbi:hypothetical protein [Alteromonas sp. S015]|uniref:hypothetical protein n=1 Tax=Alteromonas sp. S015 TaxID=3117401 RepID=UPI002FE3C4FD